MSLNHPNLPKVNIVGTVIITDIITENTPMLTHQVKLRQAQVNFSGPEINLSKFW